MTNGKFKLDQVLNLRQEVEKVRQLEFMAARGELERAEEHLRHEELEAENLAREIIAKQQDGVLAVELQLYAAFSHRKKNEIDKQREKVDTLDRRVAEKRETLLSASKDKKVLESFKEKRVSAHRQELVGKEREFMDEISIQSSGRGKP